MTQARSRARAEDRCSLLNGDIAVFGRHGGWPMKGNYFGCSMPIVLNALKDIGFNALALSNNHALDLGPPGILSTLEEVAARDFLHAGIGADLSQARRPGLKALGKRSMGLGAMEAGPAPATMYAVNATDRRPARPGVNGLEVSRIFEADPSRFEALSDIQEAFQSSSSWREVPAWVQRFARACIDAGAGVFVSHGAHVLQPVKIHRGAPIFYGIGNFLFHLNEHELVLK